MCRGLTTSRSPAGSVRNVYEAIGIRHSFVDRDMKADKSKYLINVVEVPKS